MENRRLSYSVVIPCYNCESTIERAINSALKQSKEPEQIICVDNNSSDGTLNKLKELALKDSRILVLEEKKQGASFARNKGIEHVESYYIQFLDSDDLLKRNKVQSQLELLNINTTTSVNLPLIVESYISKSSVEEKGGVVSQIQSDKWGGLIRGKLGYTVSNLWPTQVVQDCKGFDVSLKTSEEYDLLFRMLKKKVSVVISKEVNTIKINDNENALTKQNQGDNWKRYLNLRVDIVNYLKKHEGLTNEIKMAFFDMIRCAYIYNPKFSIEVYNDLLKGNFTPFSTEITSSSYLKLFRVLGFPLTDKLIHKFRR